MQQHFEFPDPSSLPEPPKRVILHWTAGNYVATPYERYHYHALIEWRGGQISVAGGVPIKNNMRPLSLNDIPYSANRYWGYAAHTRRFNSYSIGFAICAMQGAVSRDDQGDFPMLPEQVDGLIGLCANAAGVFGLPVNAETFFTHWEADHVHNVQQAGKWDITVIPGMNLAAGEVGPWLRDEIRKRIS